jgi:hypothetical protein
VRNFGSSTVTLKHEGQMFEIKVTTHVFVVKKDTESGRIVILHNEGPCDLHTQYGYVKEREI